MELAIAGALFIGVGVLIFRVWRSVNQIIRECEKVKRDE